ncbi:unnamed protein product [Lymnaea stagnalis]|uniref:Calpain catalytic domain-containing protein n=1 Tax=Lymnaea stagnalis TaxID=6523 RepID=A0AAV2IJP5_LYMST
MGCGASQSSERDHSKKVDFRESDHSHYDERFRNNHRTTDNIDDRRDLELVESNRQRHNLSENSKHNDWEDPYYGSEVHNLEMGKEQHRGHDDYFDSSDRHNLNGENYDAYSEYRDERNKPVPHTPKHTTIKPPPTVYEEDDTPFDDDGIADYEGYQKNSVGLMIKSVDFRKYFRDEEPDERPYGDPYNLYVDEGFPLEIAIVKDNNKIEWKRPKEFAENPSLFTDGATRFDIGQGSAGTCWFLSIVADIADKKNMLRQVIPDSAYNIDNPQKYDGVFHACFFRFGKWEDVYIDDYLPVIYGNVLWGAKSSTDDNEMWVALLEKAFARLHGSYDAIYGGQPGDAYLQLTGGIGERIELEGLQDKATSVFNRIRNALSSDCQVTCVVPDEYDNYKGLVGGHAYSLVAARQVGETKLLRVRNPWGHGEWTGAWCDGSKEWKTIPANAVENPNKDDGEFYVCLSDFMKYFSQTTICSLTPDFDMDGCSDSLNHILSIYGEWKGKTAAGFHKILQNPRFYFTLPSIGALEDGMVPFVVQMIQQSKKRQTDNISIRCDVFKVLGDKIHNTGRCIALEIQGQKNNVYSPEIQTSFRFKLKPGRYMIIPSSVDEGQEKAFLLRLFSPAALESVKEIPHDVYLASSENEESFSVKGKTYQLTFEKTLFGEFISGQNAGGQVSNRASYHTNPQYLLTIPDSGSLVPVVVHIMQTNEDPQYPVGLRLFKLQNGKNPPLDAQYLYENYSNSPEHIEGSQSKFVISWDVDVRYMLPSGRYIALVHLDEPNTEKGFSILFKSDRHINIKGFQTG